MSSSQQGITLEEAIEQLSLIENQLKQLQAAAAELEARLLQLSSLETALADLRSGSDDALIPLDPKATAIVRGAIKPLDKVIVHAGSNIFVEVGYDKAVEVVRREKAEVSKTLDAYKQEIAKLSQYYTALRAAVEQAISSAQQASQGQQ